MTSETWLRGIMSCDDSHTDNQVIGIIYAEYGAPNRMIVKRGMLSFFNELMPPSWWSFREAFWWATIDIKAFMLR